MKQIIDYKKFYNEVRNLICEYDVFHINQLEIAWEFHGEPGITEQLDSERIEFMNDFMSQVIKQFNSAKTQIIEESDLYL